MRVLIVEDESFLAEAIQDGLALHSISSDIVSRGEDALAAIDTYGYDVVLLDRDIVGISGDEVCRQLNMRNERPAILMVTAARRTDEKVHGFELGADDYLPKPFAFEELVARVRALGRRSFSVRPTRYEACGVSLDPFRHEVNRDGRPIRLSRKEFAVLESLMRDPGRVVSAEQLLEEAWDMNANPFTQSVKVTISSLRRKLGQPWVIRTISGVGYVIEED
ncbi:response regulator transcription factor [Trueperella pecoris]|uniref:Response regulator transcription factor n=1 Tax=Trueperella pecoris TaxID=2733571 RepID=A0A7M1QVV3_9ACTO|nr:response regulator transcription factor [Trueperella pecoris]QOQ39748.1 response regulator transcription factor [Trueperella pecoris]QOR45624.1 response regulator transcription factor [Trueperella pecoris]QTG75463.1 response regulator transcription factor [Trueperella pecoris]